MINYYERPKSDDMMIHETSNSTETDMSNTSAHRSGNIDIEQWRNICREHYNVPKSSSSSYTNQPSKQLTWNQLINSQSRQFNTIRE